MTLENQTTANENNTSLEDKANDANLTAEMNDTTSGNGLLSVNANTDTASADNQDQGNNDMFAQFMNEDGSFNKDNAQNFIKSKDDEISSANKQRDDMRRIMSKNQAVSSADDYMKTFKAEDERFNHLLDFENEANVEMKEGVEQFTKELYEAGISEAHGHVMINKMLNMLSEHGVIDTRSPEAVEKAMLDEYKKLGDDAPRIIKQVEQGIANNQYLNEDQKARLGEIANSEGAWFVQYLNNNIEQLNGQMAIPVSANDDALASDAELWAEYIKEDTSETRRNQIIEDRTKAGRGAFEV
jgi:hypothetical protein